MKRIFLFILFVVINEVSFSQDDTIMIVRKFIERGFKDYAFCSCLYYSDFKDSVNIKNIMLKDGSIAGYVNILELDMSYFDTIDSLAVEKSKTVYLSKHGEPLLFMKCLDFYNSKELQDSVYSITEKSSKKWQNPLLLPIYYHMANLYFDKIK